jgi:hypothetical protein
MDKERKQIDTLFLKVFVNSGLVLVFNLALAPRALSPDALPFMDALSMLGLSGRYDNMRVLITLNRQQIHRIVRPQARIRLLQLIKH